MLGKYTFASMIGIPLHFPYWKRNLPSGSISESVNSKEVSLLMSTDTPLDLARSLDA